MPSAAELRAAFAAFDSDGNGVLTYDRYLKCEEQLRRELPAVLHLVKRPKAEPP